MVKRRYNFDKIKNRYQHILFVFSLGLFCSAFQFGIEPLPVKANKNAILKPNSCGITVNAGPDITICAGEPKQLRGMVSGSTQYSWEPPDGLSNANILNPMANPSMTTTYTLTARGVSNNLITNGAFETGNISPATSGYTAYTVPSSFVMSTGGYMVMSVPQIVAAFGCQPTIGAFALVITPTGSGTNIWCQTIPVNPNTDYKIEYKVYGIPYLFGSPPSINIKVNGQLVGSVDAASGLCLETSGSFVWNSGSATSGDFCLFNSGGTGPFSMCAIDNITIKECCEAKDEVIVEVYELEAEIMPPPEISCDNRPLTIDASGSSSGPGITYQWTTRDGKIKSGDRTLMPVVDTPGTYVLRITGQHGCTKETSVTVNGNVTPPDISLKKNDIECTRPLGSIEASSKSKRPKYEWSGPNNFFSNKAIINNLSDAGEYIVKVIDDYGCESTDTIELKDLRLDVDISIIGDTITCGQSEAILIGKSVAKKPKFSWKDSKGNKIDSTHITAKDTGWYYLTVKDSLGCSITDSFYVFNQNTSVPIKTFSDTIDCTTSSLRLVFLGDTSGSVSWTGPRQFQSSDKSPVVQDSGWYYIRLQTVDGCTGFDSVYIYKSADIPDINVSPDDTITCLKKQIQLQGSSTTLGVSWEWIKNNNIISTNQIIQANDSGVYIFKVKAPNGCEVNRIVSVQKDTSIPIYSLLEDTITCDRPKITLQVNGQNYSKYSWSGPGAFSSDLKNPNIDVSGKYTLTVTAMNGCSSSKEVEIMLDIQKPIADLVSDTINCIRTNLPIRHNASTTIRNFQWSGPNGFSSNAVNPNITKGGIYTLTLTDKNGCSNTEIIEIIEDLALPVFQLSADTIQCRKIANIRALNLKPEYRFQWTGPRGFNSNLPIVPVVDSGYYMMSVTGPNGCIKVDSIFVIQKDKIPDVLANNDTLNCVRTKVKLTGGSSTANVQFEWRGPNGFMSNQPDPEVQDSGFYILRVIDPNGCDASKVIYIAKNASPTNFQIATQNSIIDCKDTSATLRLNLGSGNFLITWSGPNGFVHHSDSITVLQPGKYIAQVINQSGCASEDSITITDARKLPNVSIQADSINCRKTNARLRAISNDPNLQFQWTGPNGFTSSDSTEIISVGGTFYLRVSNDVNCVLTDSVSIKVDTLSPDLSLSADTLTCRRDTVPVLANSNVQGFTMRWTGPNNFQYSLPRFMTNIPGEYTCEITSSRNGCKTIKKVELIEDTSRIHQIEIEKRDAACAQNNGRIEIKAVYGGKANYQYSFDNGQKFGNSPFIDGIGTGTYQIIVIDQNHCSFTSSVAVVNSNGVDISPLPDLNLQVNEQRDIILQINIQQSDISSLRWDPADQLSCNDCINPKLTAIKDDRIYVQIVDKNGCVDTVSFLLTIRKETGIFFPTVFSPNDDNINDRFFPIGDPNAEVLRFIIFDRWGEMVYQENGKIINDYQKGWNGEFRNKKVLPGVYIYIAEVLVGGESKIYKGEITLLR